MKWLIVYLVTSCSVRTGAQQNCTNIWAAIILDENITTKMQNPINFASLSEGSGYVVAHLVEALCYKPQGRGFDSR
jgi:hypothetical protein